MDAGQGTIAGLEFGRFRVLGRIGRRLAPLPNRSSISSNSWSPMPVDSTAHKKPRHHGYGKDGSSH